MGLLNYYLDYYVACTSNPLTEALFAPTTDESEELWEL